jgi:hypothetical protein
MMENTELIMTMNRMPESFNPIKSIANGIHAILGNDCRPTAKEFKVFPKYLNFNIVSPTPTPINMEIKNPANNLNIDMAMLFASVPSSIKYRRD